MEQSFHSLLESVGEDPERQGLRRTPNRAARCARNEVLVSATHAVGFLGDTPPSEAAIGSVRATQRFRNRRVLVTVHAPRGSRAVVQIDLVCALR